MLSSLIEEASPSGNVEIFCNMKIPQLQTSWCPASLGGARTTHWSFKFVLSARWEHGCYYAGTINTRSIQYDIVILESLC